VNVPEIDFASAARVLKHTRTRMYAHTHVLLTLL